MFKLKVTIGSIKPNVSFQRCRQIALNHGLITDAKERAAERGANVPINRKRSVAPTGLFAALSTALDDWVYLPDVVYAQAEVVAKDIAVSEVPQSFTGVITANGTATVKVNVTAGRAGQRVQWGVSIPESDVEMSTVITGKSRLIEDAAEYYPDALIAARQAAGVSVITDVLPGFGSGVGQFTLGDIFHARKLGWTVEVFDDVTSVYIDNRSSRLHVKREL